MWPVCALQSWARGPYRGFNFYPLGQDENVAEEKVSGQHGCWDLVFCISACVFVKGIQNTGLCVTGTGGTHIFGDSPAGLRPARLCLHLQPGERALAV